VRREGIEPPSLPCKSRALPLDERRKLYGAGRESRTPRSSAWKAAGRPLSYLPALFVTYYLSYYTPYVRVNLIQSSSGGLAKGEVEGFFLDHIEYVCPSTLPLLPNATCVTVPPLAKNSAIA